jgi:hypothetical protein
MRPVVRQIEVAYPGWRVWQSDAGWWYATRVERAARGVAATVDGSGPEDLANALAREERDWFAGRSYQVR